MKNINFTAVIKKNEKWYIGWVEEIPGVNAQGKTLKEVRENLKEALNLILESNRLISVQEQESFSKKLFLKESIAI